MSLFFGRPAAELRSISYQDLFAEGAPVPFYEGNAARALRLVPVYAAVALIADAISTLPPQTFRGDGPDRLQITNTGFVSDFGSTLTWVDWMQQLMTSLLLRGNAYGLCTRSGAYVQRVDWLNPDTVTVTTEDSHPVYSVAGGVPVLDYAHGGPIVHVRAFLEPGQFKALSPIAQFKRNFDLQQNAVEYGGDWFQGAAVPTGILKNGLATLDPGASRRAKNLYVEQLRKPGPVVLDKNWDYQKIGATPEESQFLATIRAGATQIAAIFRVNPEDIGGESGKSMTYANREQDQQRFNVRTLLPWIVRIENALNQLLPRPQFLKLNLDALARPTLKDRIDGNWDALRSGQLTLAEVRALDDRPMLTDDEITFWQANFQTSKTESSSSNPTAAGGS